MIPLLVLLAALAYAGLVALALLWAVELVGLLLCALWASIAGRLERIR